ncbi:unnamed protein product [Mytilus edulis]|uniref:Uncharacterized protein n=1 Tax=Mytilus edulis TaxID=6550 RepID=A0A8S3Q777_MYTED|nr:unnamed protein product [Mytilus edulis]
MYARMTIVCVFLLSGIQAIEVCSDQPADIGFLIDESGSVGATNFKINLDLITKIVDDFDIGNSSVKISTFAFHELIGDGFYFSCCNDKASIKSNINSISFKGGGQDFEMALAFARKSMFQTNNGSRDFSLKILLFFTDGQSQIQDGGSLLHNLGVIVYAVGFGNDVDRNQLNKIATNESYVFMMPSYSDLIGQGYNDIKSQICIDVLTNQCDRNPQPCRNNGTCVGTGGSKYTCLCQIGYTDHNCQTDIDYCIGIICYNGGTCMDGLTSFVCQCEKYFTGILCETTGICILCYEIIHVRKCCGITNETVILNIHRKRIITNTNHPVFLHAMTNASTIIKVEKTTTSDLMLASTNTQKKKKKAPCNKRRHPMAYEKDNTTL